MAKTLLEGVNEVLKKTKTLTSANELLSLSDAGKQVFIDSAIQSWNESVDDLYSLARTPRPLQMRTGHIVLAEGVQDYELEDDLEIIYWPMHDETFGQYMYQKDYHTLRSSQSQPDNYTGIPNYAAIHPETGNLYVDRSPNANEADRDYVYHYGVDLELTIATDVFPFSNTVFRAMTEAVAEKWKLIQHNKFEEGIYHAAIGRAVRMMNKRPQHSSWLRISQKPNITDPLDEQSNVN